MLTIVCAAAVGALVCGLGSKFTGEFLVRNAAAGAALGALVVSLPST